MNIKKIICMFVILLFMVTTYPLSANMTSYNQQIEPEGRVIFMTHATGPCLIGWGAGPTGDQTPDFYMEQAKGFIINFGTMLYHNYLNDFFSNYQVENNELEVLWKVNTKTIIIINWQHENVKHHLQVICTPQEETTSMFSTKQKGYNIYPYGENPSEHESNCMVFTGFHRNGTKTESISGFAILVAVAVENTSPMFPEPIIDTILFQKEEGEYKPLITAIWSKNGWDVNGMIFPKAKTYHINYWML